jgi:predicted GIY-YIG superfamily endonuclease
VRREKRYYVYILASKSRVLYVGVTGFLMPRVLQHKSGECDRFTQRYRVNRLVYYEVFHYVNNAIGRKSEIKEVAPGEEGRAVRGRQSDMGRSCRGLGQVRGDDKSRFLTG